MIRLSDLAHRAGWTVDCPGDSEVFEVSEDSREIRPGWLFVAVPGTTQDGAAFTGEAVARGAVAVVSERDMALGIPVIRVPSARAALADAAAAIHEYPGRKLDLYGVTGTDGKTTTCFFLASILNEAGVPTAMMTTVETRIGGQVQAGQGRLTTASSSHIQRNMALMVKAGDRGAVIEISSHALDQGRLRNVQLKSAAITNIGADHLEYHGSQEAYAAAKWRITNLLQPSEAPTLALNETDATSVEMARKLAIPFVSFGSSEQAEVRICSSDSSDAQALITNKGQSVDVRVPIGGEFNRLNAAAAAAVALTQGIDLQTIACGIERSRLPAGRLELVGGGRGFDVYVDYAHTVQAFQAVLAHLRSVAGAHSGRLIAVFGAAGDRDRGKRPELAVIAAGLTDYFVITNEDPFGEDKDAIISEIAAGVPRGLAPERWTVEPDRRRAIELALDHARTGDVVVLTGKGHERSIAQSGRSIPWNDAEVARDLLNAV